MKYTELKFIKNRLAQATQFAFRSPTTVTAVVLAGILTCAPVAAQQVGGIRGKVTTEQTGTSLAGVTVTATSNVLPGTRTAVTKDDGSYSLPLLIPGRYQLTFTAADGSVRRTEVEVRLEQTSNVDVQLDGSTSNIEVIEIVGTTIVREGNSSLTNSLGATAIESLPIGQDYRDLLKLIPGVQYSENATLGPAAGGSGVDNKYGFDGVDVSLPLFGNLASEPSTHDVLHVSMDRGGAKAVGFNRSGGFAIDTVSKSGTDEYKGSVEYKLQDKSMVSDITGDVPYELDQSWITAGFGGPVIKDALYFYGSYYRPEVDRVNKETAYGPVKSYNSTRDEFFGKLTWAAADDLLFNISQRSSDREVVGASIGTLDSNEGSLGEKAEQDIFTLDGSWLIDGDTALTFNINNFSLKSSGTPDTILSVNPTIGSSLDLNNLNQMGRFSVPTLRPDTPENAAFNAAAQTLINQYGYIDDSGNRAGGGRVGGYNQFDITEFSRQSVEIALDREMELGNAWHNFHIGVKYSELKEELSRVSNGWGTIGFLGGLSTTVPGAFYQATIVGADPSVGSELNVLESSVKTYNLEINDTITSGDFEYNIGVLISKDVLYGQGLRENANNLSGYELAPGNKYKMYTMDWDDMIQPRLGVTRRYDGENTVFGNVAVYHPEANSLARAASWDRSTLNRITDVYFDEDGDFVEERYRGSSSGKFFADGLKPRRIDEFTIGTTKAMSSQLYLRGHIRHRKGSNFWEDVPNAGRLSGTYGNGQVPADIAAKGLYIPELADYRSEIGGSSYVIAEVDGGYTKYWEASIEAEWIGDRTYLNASYVWSRYTGNFDQDNTTTTNDANTFIGSSFYNDEPGKFSWDNKDGTLSSDKPHLLKVFGYYTLDWDANVGAYFLYQSGQAWETWSAEYYGHAPTSSYYAANAYAEKAGSRRTSSHWQVDLNYTQNFAVTDKLNMKFQIDIFNLFDRQTGYNVNPYDYQANYGEARSFYLPRRIQLSVGIDF
ncbi:MAG: TonB-dependent receptor [Rheinheimera sp.]|nr:TonB-dependent receptor [Rheinheimera sp.]